MGGGGVLPAARRVEDPGKGTGAWGQSPPVIKSSARWRHACPPGNRGPRLPTPKRPRRPSRPPILGPGALPSSVVRAVCLSTPACPAAHDTCPALPLTCR